MSKDITNNFSVLNADLPESVDNALKNLTDLPSKNVGQTLSDCWFLVFGGISQLAEKRKLKYAKDLEEFKQSLSSKITSIPKENRVEANTQIVMPALESDIYCEAICDGRHLHPGTVRLLLKVKGLDKVVAITDSIMAAGLPDGRYKLGVNDVIVEDGDAKLENGVRAGSTLTQNVALKNLLAFTGKRLEEILPLLSENPARLIKVYDKKGSIADGKDADIVLLDAENDIADVFVGGNLIER